MKRPFIIFLAIVMITLISTTMGSLIIASATGGYRTGLGGEQQGTLPEPSYYEPYSYFEDSFPSMTNSSPDANTPIIYEYGRSADPNDTVPITGKDL